MKYLLIALVAVFLAACNPNTGGAAYSGLIGTYTSQDGKNSYTLTSDGKIGTKNKIYEKVTTFTIEKNKVEFQFQDGLPQSLKINDDGSVVSDSGMLYKKIEGHSK